MELEPNREIVDHVVYIIPYTASLAPQATVEMNEPRVVPCIKEGPARALTHCKSGHRGPPITGSPAPHRTLRLQYSSRNSQIARHIEVIGGKPFVSLDSALASFSLSRFPSV